nr:gliding motility-associated C-terminal domain-containing protein [uncultured Marinifilum sp.]
MICFFNGYSENEGKIVVGSSFYIGENAVVFTNFDLKINETSNFRLEGNCILRESSMLELPSYFIGNGILLLQGDTDISLSGYNSSLGVLCADMDGGDIYVDEDISITNKLQLYSGKIITNPGKSIILTNSDQNAIEFSDDISNESYIQGGLSRSVIANTKYSYPVGDAYGFHPMYLYDTSGEGDLRVIYDENIPAQWESSNIRPSLHLNESGAWVLTDDSGSELNFKVGLSTLDSYGQMISDPCQIFYASDYSFEKSDMSYQSTAVGPYYLEGGLVKSVGIYSLAESDLEMGELANTLIVNGRDESRFKIDLDKFQNVRLLVFDSFGREVFNRNSYNNDFDAQYFRSGTYYYYLTGRLVNGEEIVRKNIIEVIHSN